MGKNLAHHARQRRFVQVADMDPATVLRLRSLGELRFG